MSIRAILCFCLSGALPLLAQGSISTFYPNFQRALQLSDSQWSAVTKLQDEYQSYLSSKYQRLTQVTQEIQTEKIQPQPDPNALGLGYYEIAAICQESTARNAAYRQNLRAQLTPQQATVLQQIDAASTQLPTLGEAQELAFLNPQATPQANPQDPRQVWSVSRFSSSAPLPGCPGNAVIGGFFLLTGNSALYPNLVRYLQVTAAQVDQMQFANSRLQEDLAESYGAEQKIRLEIETESALPTPRPSLLGENAARLEQICRSAIALQAGLEQSLSLILNPTQRTRLTELNQALRLLPVLAESQTLGLSPRTVPDSLPSPFQAQAVIRSLEWSVGSVAGPNLPGCQVFPSPNNARWFDRTSFPR